MRIKLFSTMLILSLVALGAFSTVVPGKAMATDDGVPQIMPEDGAPCDDIVFEQNEGSNDGTSGDPDSAGTGLGFMGGFDSDDCDWSGIIVDQGLIQDEICFLLQIQMVVLP